MDDDPVRGARAVGRNIHRLRAAAGLSLADLAAAGEISKTTLHGIEQGAGNPTLSTLWALATALRVPLGELLEPDETPVTVVVYAIEVDPVEQASRAHLPGVEECLVITGGALRTGPADAPVDLAEGDSVRFGAARPHLYRGLGGPGAG